VRVVTDGAVALDPRDAAACGLRIVPMTVEAGTRPGHGGVPAADPDGRPRTSAPSPGRFLEAVTDPPAPAGVVIVTVAGTLSAAHRAAALAARLSAREGGPPVEVVDSGSAAGGQALVALAAARAAADGLPAAAVAEAARAAAADLRLLGVVGSLDAVVRGGRLPGVAGAAGRLAGLHAMFELRSGRVRPLRPAFSRPAAIGRLLAAFRRDLRPGGAAEIAVSHACAAREAEALAEELSACAPAALVLVGAAGPAIVAHAGPGTLGLAWRWRRPGR